MAFASLPPSTKSFLLLLFLVALPSLSHQQRIRLIHRDSPASPVFDSSATMAEKWRGVHRRSVAYRDHLHAALKGHSKTLMPLAAEDEEAGFDQIGGEYLMEFAMGTPPVPVTAMPDVPGDFKWTQCAPCPGCHPSLGPLYDPSKSSTSTTNLCMGTICDNDLYNWRCGSNNTCMYFKYNGNNSKTTGPLITDVLTVGGLSCKDMSFGCSSDNSFSTKLAPARVGLLGSSLVLLFSFNLLYRMPYNIVSHCLMMGNTSSYLRQGGRCKAEWFVGGPP